MPHVAELSYPGRWLEHDDHAWSLRVESRFHRLERFLAEAAIALNLFEGAIRARERGRPGSGGPTCCMRCGCWSPSRSPSR